MIIPTIIIKCLFLIPLVLIGLITSYSDIKYGKIKNINLLIGFFYIIFLYLFLFFYSYFIVHQAGNFKYLTELMINGLIAFIVGYILWHFNLWAAGDAKLFIFYALSIPLEFYSNNYVHYFPSSMLLVDTFLFICLALFLKIFSIFATYLFSYLKKPFSLSPFFLKINYKALKTAIFETGKMFVISSCFLVILQYVLMKINIIFQKLSFDIFFIYLLFFILQFILFKNLFKNKIFIVLIILGGLLCSSILIDSNQISLLIITIKSSIFLILFVSTIIPLVYIYIERQEIKKINVQELCSGNFLSVQSTFVITNMLKEQAKGESLGTCFSDGLTESQVKMIRKLFKNDQKKELYICRTFPFAPFMFLSFVFIILAKSSFLFFLLRFWGLFK